MYRKIIFLKFRSNSHRFHKLAIKSKIHVKISTKLFFLSFFFKDAKSYHVSLFIIYTNIIFIFERLGHLRIKIFKCIFEKKYFLLFF